MISAIFVGRHGLEVVGMDTSMNDLISRAGASFEYERLPSEPIGVAPITITVLDDASSAPIQYARIWIGKQTDKSQILIGETDSNGVVQQIVSYYGVTEIIGWCRQMDLTGTDYAPKEFSGVMTSQGFSTILRLTPAE